jgi:hypothetical protein
LKKQGISLSTFKKKNYLWKDIKIS